MIPISFVLKANTAAFTKAVAGAETRIQKLKKTLSFAGAGGLAAGLGVGALAAGFVGILKNAQALRDTLTEAGRPIDASIASAAKLGDAFDRLKQGASEWSVAVLGTLASWGEATGSLINRLRGVSAEQEKLNERIASDTEATLARIAKAREQYLAANSPEKLAAAEARLNRVREEGAMKVANTEMRLVMLTQQKRTLETEIAGLKDGTVRKVEAAIELAELEVDLTAERRKQEIEITAEKEKQAKIEKEIYDLGQKTWDIKAERDAIMADQKRTRADTYLPSVEELAETARQNIRERESYGVGASGSLVDALAPDSAEMRALRVVEAEDAARAVARDTSLDPVTRLQRASMFQSEAEELRGGLTGFAQSKDTNIGAEFKSALADSEAKLDQVVEGLKGLIKAQ